MRRGGNIIIPLLTPPPHVDVRKAEILGQPHPMEAHRAHYACVLIDNLLRQHASTGKLDKALADRIEGVLWPAPAGVQNK